MQPLISIIIPTFNRAHLIEETLESIAAQTYTNWECIVVDDGSRDATEKVLQKWEQQDQRFRFYKRPDSRPKGANACRNYGFEKSNGSYVNWFDSDDLMHPEKLDIQIKLLSESDVVMCVCQSADFQNSIADGTKTKHARIISKDPFNDFIQNKIKFFTPAPLINKQFLLENQLTFNEELQRAQEFDFFVRLLAVDAAYVATEAIGTYVRVHPQSISGSSFSKEKVMSIYESRFQILENFVSEITPEAKHYCIQKILTSYSSLLVHKEFEAAKKVKAGINSERTIFEPSTRRKVNLAYLSYRLFGKGGVILK